MPSVSGMYMDKVKGILSEAGFVDMSREFSQEKERLETQITAFDAQLAELDARIAAAQ